MFGIKKTLIKHFLTFKIHNMMRILLICLMLLSALVTESWAQDRTVSGKVTDDSGESVPGANVILKGTTTGTTADIDGNYKLSVPSDGGILVFSFVGMEQKEVEIGSRSVIDLIMAPDAKQLSEVVVTALGTKQNAISTKYANQTVGSDELLSSPSKDALSALRGKTAGVNITSGTSVGASSRIVLRGAASLTGDNNGLIVIDGIPIDNSSNVGGAQQGEGGFSDYGNRFNDFDPNNIESITILKGPSATSLYGSRGASGVILITTKSGSAGGLKVELNSTTSVERAYVLLQRQDQFGQGLINPDGSNNIDSGENFSWGAAYDGITRPWTSPVDVDGDGTLEYLSRPYEAAEDQLENFFRDGYTRSNGVSISGGSDKFTFFGSYNNTNQEGIMDNTNYNRNSITLNTSAKLTKKLSAAVNLTYSSIDQNTTSEGSRAFEGNNAYANVVQAATNIPYPELRDYNNPYHSFDGFYGSYTVNPYFVLNEYVNNAKINNILASVNLTYTPIENLTLNTRYGTNFIDLNQIQATPQYAYNDHLVWGDNLALSNRGGRQFSDGFYSEELIDTRVIDWTSTASYSKDIVPDLNATATIGFNMYDVKNRSVRGETVGGLVIPEIYNLGNSSERAVVEQDHNQKRIYGLFGNVSFGYKDVVFLEYSARNDWSSTLPVDNQAFDYHAVGASAIINDMLKWDDSNPINYFKLRASYGTTGKDADIHLLSSLYSVNPTLIEYDDNFQINGPLEGQTAITKNSLIGNNTLKPELTTTLELGTDVSFFNSRIELSYTYYNAVSTDQIVEVELPSSSGYRFTALNVGEMKNSGHEVALNLVPVSLPNSFRWDINLTWAKNINEVVKISDDLDELILYSSGRGVTLNAVEGEAYGVWKGQVPLLTENGQQVVDASGSVVYTDETQVAGSVQADWIGGIVNTFSFKGLSLGVVLDTRQGGEFFSLTKSATEFNGTALTTLIGDRQPFVVPNSVVDNGDGTYSENTNTILADSYVFDGNYTRNLIDASFIKLREITLGYALPSKILNPIKIQSASVNLFAKNVIFWLPSENTFADPEVLGPQGSVANVTGVESTQTPPSRSFGVQLKITL